MGRQRGRRTRTSRAHRPGRRGRRPYNPLGPVAARLALITALRGIGPSIAAPQEGRYRGSASHRRRDQRTATTLHVGSAPTRVGELHRRALTARAITNPLETGQTVLADVAASAAVVVVAAGRDARAVAVHLALGAAKSAGAIANTLEAPRTRRTDIAAGAAMTVVAARIDADTAAVGLAHRAATAARGANPTAANTAGAGIRAGPAVFGIGGEIAAAILDAAILDTDWAVCALADSAPALDGNEPALANLPARSTIVHIGLEIDADTAAIGQTGLTGRGIALRGSTSRAASRDGHRGQERERLPA
jgi:hypothetical protein